MKNASYLGFLIIILVSFFLAQPRLLAKYISVVDSGSTGSVIYLFDINDEEGIPKYTIYHLIHQRRNPGFSHVLPEEVESYMEPLIQSLKKGIPQGVKESDIDFYFLATGDMRAVSPYVQKKIFSVMKEYLAKNTELNVKVAGTMPEKMEGIYDWLCINIVENKIGTDSTYGVIDIGGSTIQIAYAVDKMSDNTSEVKIGKFKHMVHSRSYLGIGNDQAREQFLDDPCSIPKNLALVTTTGNGDYNSCLKAVKSLLVDVHHIEPIPPEVLAKTKFIGFAYFYYLLASKPFNLGNEASIDDIKAKAEDFAKLTWEEMVMKWPDDKYLHAYYLGSALVVDLLEVLGFNPSTKIQAQELYGGAGDSWALGAAVYSYYDNQHI